MSVISDEENCTQSSIECQSTELDKLEQEWSNINWNKVNEAYSRFNSR